MSAGTETRLDLPSPDSPNFNQRIRETLMTYLGRTGNSLDKGVTLRDLQDAGIIKVSTSGTGSSASTAISVGGAVTAVGSSSGSPTDTRMPPTPTGFYASAGIGVVFVGTDVPNFQEGGGYASTNVYTKSRVPTDPLPTFAQAAKLTDFRGAVSSFASDPATTWHLWVTWVSKNGTESGTAAGGVNGIQVTTGQDITKLLKAMTGKLTTDQLYSDLGTAVGMLTAPETTQGSYKNLLAYSVNTSKTAYSAVQAQATAVAGLSAQYTVKVDVNGYVSGYGLASTAVNGTPRSTFAVRSDAFYIASPSGPGITPSMPFIVYTTGGTINGVSYSPGVYIQDAFIRNGQITNAMIGNAAIGTAQIANAAITSALIGNAQVGTLQIAGQSVTVPSAFSLGSVPSGATSYSYTGYLYLNDTGRLVVMFTGTFPNDYSSSMHYTTVQISVNGSLLYQEQAATGAVFSASVNVGVPAGWVSITLTLTPQTSPFPSGTEPRNLNISAIGAMR